MSHPAISVYIPTHNRRQMLERAVRSLQSQTFSDFEAIIVDDGSSDGTEAYLKALVATDSKFRYLRHEIPRGACAARNSALAVAKGEFVTGLDDDDEFLPQRLEFFINSPVKQFAFIYAPQYWHYGRAKRVLRSNKPEVSLQDLLSLNYVGNQVFVEKKKLMEVGGFDVNMPACQDWDTWIRLARRFGKAYSLEQPTYVTHTAHENNRITASGNRIRGHELIMERYADISSPANKKSQELLLVFAKHEKMTLSCLLRVITKENYLLCLRYFLSSHFKTVARLRAKLLRGK